MPKTDKKDDKKDERREDKKIYIDDGKTVSKALDVTPRSSKAAYDDVKLKDIIEKARENAPAIAQTNGNRDRPYASYAAAGAEPQKTTHEEIGQDREDGIRLYLFAGVLLGVLILLCLFGGPYSPLNILGFAANVKTTAAAAPSVVASVIAAAADNSTNDTQVVAAADGSGHTEKELAASTGTVDILISNWRMTPDTVNAKVGTELTLNMKSGEAACDVYIDGFEGRAHVEPGKPNTLKITPTTAGSYRIHALTWNSGSISEAGGMLVVE